MQLRAGTYLQDRYEILECIGSGGMSYVYKALDHKLNRFVGIKVLKEEFCTDTGFVSRFKMEAQAAAGLSHPNIVSIYDVVDEGELHYIVMELVDGITLEYYITKKGRLGIKEALGISIQIAQGINAAHQQGIIHRDIKPQNVIISTEGKVKVADFGIARATSADTITSTASGSVHYISPEQARGQATDTRSDIYSLGITMYEMVTGRTPFDGETSVSVAIAQIESELPLPSSLNPNITEKFEEIIIRCCQKKPARRYQYVQDVITDLRIALDEINSGKVQLAPEKKSSFSTRVLTEEEMGAINTHVKQNQRTVNRREEIFDEPDDVETGKDRVFTIVGIVAAVLIVIAVLVVVFRYGKGLISDTNELKESLSNEISGISEKETLVPDVKGLSYELAKQKLEDYNLMIKVERYEKNDSVEPNVILDQSPSPDTVMSKFETVSVVVSESSDGSSPGGLQIAEMEASDNPSASDDAHTLVPQLIGQPVEVAIALLAESELQPGEETTVVSEDIPAGYVVSQGVLAGTEIAKGATVSYTVSLGSSQEQQKYYAAIRTQYSMTDLIGPGSSSEEVIVMIRLHQILPYEFDENGEPVHVYTTLMEPRAVKGDVLLPIKFDYIEGADGVDTGTLEVVKCNSDGEPEQILKDFPLEFFRQ